MTDNEKTSGVPMNSSGELSDDEIEEVTGGVQGRTGNFNKSHDNNDSCSHYACKYCGMYYDDRHLCDTTLWIYKAYVTCKHSSYLTYQTRLCNYGSE